MYNKKLVKEFLILLGILDILTWGVAAIISIVNHVNINDNMYVKLLYFIGSFAPFASAIITLKRNGKIKDFKSFFKKCFNFKERFIDYFLVLEFVFIYYFIGYLTVGFSEGAPLIALIIITPLMLFGGGSEEFGFRLIMQHQLEKKYNFVIATLITGLVTTIWHLPLFFVLGTINSKMDFVCHLLMVMSLSFALATERRVSRSMFTCILLHCIINALSVIFVFSYTLTSSLITFIVISVLSTLVIDLNKRLEKKGIK